MDGRASPRCGGLDLIYRGIFSLFDFSAGTGSDWRWGDRVVFLFLGLREIFFENSFISFVIFFAFLNECDRGGLSIEKERKNKEEEEDRFGKFLDRKIRLLAF